MEEKRTSVGIDVSKGALDVSAYPGGNTWRVEYTPAATAVLAGELADLEPGVVVAVIAAETVVLVAK